MLYQSVQQSVAAYNRQKEQQETQQQKLVFKWKFLVIGLGVILIILIGVLSQIYKQISSRQTLEYDTTFIYDLIKDSQFFDSSQSMINFLKGFNSSENIVFDNATMIYKGKTFNETEILSKIKDNNNILYFLDVDQEELFDGEDSANNTHARFGMFLRQAYEDNDVYNETRQILVTDQRSSKISSVFSFDKDFGTRLNYTDQCYLYRHRPNRDNFLSLVDTFQIQMNEPGSLKILLRNNLCLGKSQVQAQQNLERLTQMSFDPSLKQRLRINRIQVFELQMRNKEVSV